MSAVLVDAGDVAPESDTGAPIVLVTGLPGHGKSLFALSEFAVGKRNVYQAGIPGCQLPTWEPEKWQEMPAGSTLIVDEAQDFFPPKSPTAEPPPHYVANKIRHKGLSLVLLTQHPNMLDARIRRLSGRHVHVVRVFGEEKAVLYEWVGVGDVDASGREGATRRGWEFPKAVYRLYKSSDQHRPMQKTPWRVRAIPWIIGGVVVLFAVGGWVVFGRGRALARGEVGSAGSASSGGSASAFVRSGNGRDVSLTPVEYAATFKPRVAGLDYTAPRYDQVTKPVRAPVPAACIANADKCSCYSQQATPLQVGDAMCRQIVAGGYFKDFDDGDDQKRDKAQSSPVAASLGAPVVAGTVVPLAQAGVAVIGAPGAASAGGWGDAPVQARVATRKAGV